MIVHLTWQRLGRGCRYEGQIEVIELPDGLTDEAFIYALSEELFTIADRNLMSNDIWTTARFDDGSTHAGSFSINAERFGLGRWELVPPPTPTESGGS